jgi:hypothetical protein
MHEMIGPVAHRGKRRVACRVLVEKSVGRSRFEALGMGG